MIIGLVARNLLRRKTRALMGFAGVLVTIALLTLVSVGLESVALSAVDLMTRSVGRADLWVKSEAGMWLDPAFFDAAPAMKKLESVPKFQGFSQRVITRVNVGEQAVSLVGIDPAVEKALGQDDVTPWPNLAGGQCAMSRQLANVLKESNEVTLSGGVLPAPVTLKCTTIVERQQLLTQVLPHFVIVDLATAQQIAQKPGQITVIAGRFADAPSYYDGRDLAASLGRAREVGRRVPEALGPEFEIMLPRVAPLGRVAKFEAPMQAVFGLLLVVTLAVTAFLLHALLSISAEEQVREHAIFRALGGKRRQLFQFLLAEAALVAALGVVPGIAVGVGASYVAAKVLPPLFGLGGLTVPVVVSFATVRLVLLAGVALSALSAALPGLRAMRIAIVDGLDPMRRGGVPKAAEEGSARGRLVASGLAVAVASALVFFLLPAAYLTGDTSMMGAAGLVLLIVMLGGFSFAGLGLLPLLRRLFARPVALLGETPADLAQKNVARYERRYFASSVLLTIASAFVFFAASLVQLYDDAKGEFVERQLGADILIHLMRSDRLDIDAPLAAMDGIASFASIRTAKPVSDEGFANSVVAADLVASEPISISLYGASPSFVDTILTQHLQCEEGSEPFAKMAADPGPEGAPGVPPPVIISMSLARYLDVHVGDQLQLDLRLGGSKANERAQIVGVCSKVPGLLSFRARVVNPVGSGVLMSANTYKALTKSVPQDSLLAMYYVKAKGPSIPVVRRIRDQLSTSHSIIAQSVADEESQAEDLYRTTQALGILLLGVSLSIAAFGLIAAMATTVMERKFEIGVLGAVGLRKKGILRMLAAEALLLTWPAGIVGTFVGWLLAYLFASQTTSLYEIPVHPAVPWLLVVVNLVVCTVVGVIAAWIPARRMLREPLASALVGGTT